LPFSAMIEENGNVAVGGKAVINSSGQSALSETGQVAVLQS